MNTSTPIPRTVALLPMKAHSERIPGKNFRDFAGRPLFRWVLDTLLASPRIASVVINTDAVAILRDAGLSSGGRVLLRERKPELCGDLVSMNRILADDIADIEADAYLMTHTTNPLLSLATIHGALDAYQAGLAAGSCDSLFSVDRVQTRFYRADASPVNHDPGNLVRTQDLEPWFEENSNLYLFNRDSFAASGARIGRKPLLFTSPPRESIDIDNPEDWDFALLAARHFRESEGG